jgi:hypothetical protein
MTMIAAATSEKKPRSHSSARSAGAKSDFGFPLPLDTPPMEARSSDELPDSAGPWQYTTTSNRHREPIKAERMGAKP